MLISRTNERDSQITKKRFNSGTRYHRGFSSLVFVCDGNVLSCVVVTGTRKFSRVHTVLTPNTHVFRDLALSTRARIITRFTFLAR